MPTGYERIKTGPTRKPPHPHINVPQPTAEEVATYQKLWDALDDYREQEHALNRLFFELAPENEDITDILLKATALNSFYSTNIFSIYPVAIHSQLLHIDARLKAGDESLVNDIMAVTINGKRKQFYSFASKYCSHHNPECYPIYDSYVVIVLRHFRDTDGFAAFRTEELKVYPRFKEVLVAFRSFYGLEQFSLKEIDKYLWQFGKNHFPKTYR